MNELTTYSSNVTKLTTEIKVIQDNVCQGMIEIGKRLIEIKKELGHGQFETYLKNVLNYSRVTGSRLIKIANEFSIENVSTLKHLDSSRIIALLDLSSEYRDGFIQKSNIEESTVRELKAEIQKYKEENGLLTEKQQKALEEKRKAEQEKAKLEDENFKRNSKIEQLQRQLSKASTHVTVEKIVEVEKVVTKVDDETLKKLQKLEEDNKRLQESKRVYEEAMNTYKKSADEYQDFKDKLFKMSCVKGGDVDEVKALEDMNNLYIGINRFIRTELSPVQYEYCLSFVNKNEYITESFVNMINTVEDWCLDMREKLNQNNNIITVEVK